MTFDHDLNMVKMNLRAKNVSLILLSFNSYHMMNTCKTHLLYYLKRIVLVTSVNKLLQ